MTYISIPTWGKYQHYSKRNPPWIKLYRETLTSQTWISGTDASRVLMIAIMMLASETGNMIPNDPEYIRRRAFLNSKVDLSHLISCGFIEISQDASTTLAGCNQNATPETEIEKRKNARKQFSVPTVEQCREYAVAISIPANEGDAFHDHFTARDWRFKDGKKMCDWQASMRTWKRNMNAFGKGEIPKPKPQLPNLADIYHD